VSDTRDLVGSHLRDQRRDTAAELEALRTATREAHEVLKDLRTERRAVEQMLAGIEGRVRRAVADLIESEVARQVAELGKVTERAMRDSVAKVGREFDRLASIYLGRNDDGRTLEELTRLRAKAGG
jgi:predicted  nucleic acid-binding Zn-ribbon protein